MHGLWRDENSPLNSKTEASDPAQKPPAVLPSKVSGPADPSPRQNSSIDARNFPNLPKFSLANFHYGGSAQGVNRSTTGTVLGELAPGSSLMRKKSPLDFNLRRIRQCELQLQLNTLYF